MQREIMQRETMPGQAGQYEMEQSIAEKSITSRTAGAASVVRDMTRQLAPLGVVVGGFTDRETANDAIADLRYAGFGHNEVAVAFAPAGQVDGKMRKPERNASKQRPEEHSWLWKFRQHYEWDIHQRGEEQMSGGSQNILIEQGNFGATEVDLWQALEVFGTASEDRISILNHDIGPDGALVLVKCEGRAREVEAILEKNSGAIYTETVTMPTE